MYIWTFKKANLTSREKEFLQWGDVIKKISNLYQRNLKTQGNQGNIELFLSIGDILSASMEDEKDVTIVRKKECKGQFKYI